MTEVHLVRCDGCKQEVVKEQSKNWLKTDVEVRGQSHELHFDSYECMARWAESRAQEGA